MTKDEIITGLREALKTTSNEVTVSRKLLSDTYSLYCKEAGYLKPCPFCGDTPATDYKFWPMVIKCPNCGATIRSMMTPEEGGIEKLEEKWNRRVGDDA